MNRSYSTPLSSDYSWFTTCLCPLYTLVLSLRKAGACSPYGLPDSQVSCLKGISQTNCANHFHSAEAYLQRIYYQKQLAKGILYDKILFIMSENIVREWSPNCC
ncbi:hypothetical protein QL285_052861 [Trifolium repens]|nr:hypothetical protein QL285_052861 [Trifolium repens]